MRVLVTWGSKAGATESIGRTIAEQLVAQGHDVVAEPVQRAASVGGFDAVVIGGTLHANRWPRSVQSFVFRHTAELRNVPVWFFSSGPLDDSPDRADLAPPTSVAVLAERVGALGHVTFGGRLDPDIQGFSAGSLARKRTGDWRSLNRVRRYADGLAGDLASAKPGVHVEHPARSLPRLLNHAMAGWAISAVAMAVFLALVGPTAAFAARLIVTPAVFLAMAWHYFSARGARDPLPTATTWTALVILFDLLVVGGAAQHSFKLFTSVMDSWAAYALTFAVVWTTGVVIETMPSSHPPLRSP